VYIYASLSFAFAGKKAATSDKPITPAMIHDNNLSYFLALIKGF
jgi:hypothetical protein